MLLSANFTDSDIDTRAENLLKGASAVVGRV